MWSHKFFFRMNFKLVIAIVLLMVVSLAVISSMSFEIENEVYFTPLVKKQIQRFFLGWVLFFFFAGLNYQKLREWTWLFYAISLLALIGLYFAPSIQNVQRWFKIPIIGINIQPSEFAKLSLVFALAWFLEKRQDRASSLTTAFLAAIIVGIPFFLILKQPDLGTALVLCPISLGMCYLGSVNAYCLKVVSVMSLVFFIFVSSIFLGIFPHEKMRPMVTKVMKDYQYERLNPNNYHQKASQTAIALGGVVGTGWHQSEFSSKKYLPASYTDSVFPAFVEEFGLLGAALLLALFFLLIWSCFKTAYLCKDQFGFYLSTGIAIYLAMHILINIAMMCGVLPITGVPLILVTYGGSSVLTTMIALGIIQSIYSRRFMF